MMHKRALPLTLLLGGISSANALSLPPGFLGSLGYVTQHSGEWFDYSFHHVVAPYPAPGSKFSEQDRAATMAYYQPEGTPRRDLAEQDSNTTPAYYQKIYGRAVFGDRAGEVPSFLWYSGFRQPLELMLLATLHYDPNEKNFFQRFKEMVTEYKDYYNRPRPSDAFQDLKHFRWRDDYPQSGGHSYLSGHTTAAFGVASPFMLLFPERGEEILSRAFEIGEGRVVRASHFASDTIAARANDYFYLSRLLADDNTRRLIVADARRTRAEIGLALGDDMHSILNDLPSPVADMYRRQGYRNGYYGQADRDATPGTEVANIPQAAGNLLYTRFPYLNNQQRRQLLASTSYPAHSLAGYMIKKGDPDTYWGIINLARAFRGPARLATDFTVDQRTTDDDIAGFGKLDNWKNDIGGPGLLIKQGEGRLILSGNNHFGGIDIEQGTLVLNGENLLQHDSRITHGELQVDGRLNHTLTVASNGTLSGHGNLGNVRIEGGTLSPGSPPNAQLNPNGQAIGQLTVEGNLSLANGATYHVDIDDKGHSDRVRVKGSASLDDSHVDIGFTHAGWFGPDLSTLYDHHYTLLSAEQGITGTFQRADLPLLQRPFLTPQLSYGPHDVTLGLIRNHRPFVLFAANGSQRSIANAIEKRAGKTPPNAAHSQATDQAAVIPTTTQAEASLPATHTAQAARLPPTATRTTATRTTAALPQPHIVGPATPANPSDALYRSVALSLSAHDAQNAYRQLGGQIHTDGMAATLDRDQRVGASLMDRLAQYSTVNGGWLKLLDAHTHMNARNALSGYSTNDKGIQMGIEGGSHHTGAGLAFTYLDGHMHNQHQGKARSDNYYLSAYARQSLGHTLFMAGATYGWHDSHTHRGVQLPYFGGHSDASAHAHNWQAFLQASHEVGNSTTNLRPYARLAYDHLSSGSLNETGGEQALHADRQTNTDLRSTAGVHFTHQQPLNQSIGLHIGAGSGWTHQFHDTDRNRTYRFSDGDIRFTTASPDSFRNAATVDASIGLTFNNGMDVSLSYTGLFARGRTDNGANLGLNWHF